MPAKYDRCVKKVRARIKSGKIPKTYKANGRKKSNPYAICSKLRAKGKKQKPIRIFEHSGKFVKEMLSFKGLKDIHERKKK